MRLADLSKRLGQKILFDRLSFALDRNKICYLYGDNGIGKTILFRCIVGIGSCSGIVEKTGNCFRVSDSIPSYLNLTRLDNLTLLTKNQQIKKLISKQKTDFLPLSFLSYVKVKDYFLRGKKIFSLLLLLLLAPRVVLLDGVLNGLNQKNRKVLLCCSVQLKEETTIALSDHKEYYLEMADELSNVKSGEIEPVTPKDLRNFSILIKRR